MGPAALSDTRSRVGILFAFPLIFVPVFVSACASIFEWVFVDKVINGRRWSNQGPLPSQTLGQGSVFYLDLYLQLYWYLYQHFYWYLYQYLLTKLLTDDAEAIGGPLPAHTVSQGSVSYLHLYLLLYWYLYRYLLTKLLIVDCEPIAQTLGVAGWIKNLIGHPISPLLRANFPDPRPPGPIRVKLNVSTVRVPLC